MADTDIRGRLLWYELLTRDTSAAARFYSAVVGWTLTPFDENAAASYSMWTRPDGKPVGGLLAIPEGMTFPPHWAMYVGVRSIEDTVVHVERRGGSAVTPIIDIPKVGRVRTLRDPQGAAFSVFEPSASQPPEAQPTLGDVSWLELMTTSPEAALAFYQEVFGWQSTGHMDMGEMGTYHMFGRSWPLGGMMATPAALSHVPPYWGLYFQVSDVRTAADRVRAAGGQVVNGPTEVPGGDMVINCVDPQGAAFSLHHRQV